MKTKARQCLDITRNNVNDLRYLCENNSVLSFDKDGSTEWDFEDGSTVEIDSLNQVKIDGKYI